MKKRENDRLMIAAAAIAARTAASWMPTAARACEAKDGSAGGNAGKPTKVARTARTARKARFESANTAALMPTVPSQEWWVKTRLNSAMVTTASAIMMAAVTPNGSEESMSAARPETAAVTRASLKRKAVTSATTMIR